MISLQHQSRAVAKLPQSNSRADRRRRSSECVRYAHGTPAEALDSSRSRRAESSACFSRRENAGINHAPRASLMRRVQRRAAHKMRASRSLLKEWFSIPKIKYGKRFAVTAFTNDTRPRGLRAHRSVRVNVSAATGVAAFARCPPYVVASPLPTPALRDVQRAPHRATRSPSATTMPMRCAYARSRRRVGL